MTVPAANPASQVRIHTLCAALNVCVAQLRIMIQSGQVPRPDFYRHGKASYWELATIRAWRPEVARVISTIQAASLPTAA